jgi:hypothetical protein
MGSWLDLAQTAYTSASAWSPEIWTYKQAFRFKQKGGGNLAAAARRLVEERNNAAHGVRPTTDYEAEVRLAGVGADLELLTQASRPLLESATWFLTERCSLRLQQDFDVVGLAMRGAHPDFERERRIVSAPLPDDYVIQFVDDQVLHISPFVQRRVCQECGQMELYYVDKFYNGAISLKSFERPHAMRLKNDSTAEHLDVVLRQMREDAEPETPTR